LFWSDYVKEGHYAQAIAHLSALAGIAPTYRDAWGDIRDVAIDTRRALLAGMGFAVDTAAATDASIQAFEDDPWRRRLPPCVLARENDETPRCELVIDGSVRERPVRWTIDTEAGQTLHGVLQADTLEFAATRVVDGVDRCRFYLPLPPGLPAGYHRLAVQAGDDKDEHATCLIIAPTRAHVPAALEREAGLWGLAIQLYGLRSSENQGIGDFGDLLRLAEGAGRQGAAAIALNPLHTLFPGNPEHISPYDPSSREFLNSAYIRIPDTDVDAAALRDTAMLDYAAVLPAKLRALENDFCDHGRRDPGFQRFLQQAGPALRDLAVFQALSENLGTETPWRDWPENLRDPASPSVAEFKRQNSDRVEFYIYLQWLADRQLGTAAGACEEAAMPIGLCRDLAVGSNRWGAETWRYQGLFATDVSIGAPPDLFNQSGQNWGMPPVNPLRLREQAYRPFITLLRANMRHAGALRVDHILGWMRAYWVPEGSAADRGGYVANPVEDMLAIAALESRRHQCAIIGEDLGTIPEGLRKKLDSTAILSTRVLYFERSDEHGFNEPREYPRLAAASISTHDLPTLAGFFCGHDITVRTQLDLFPSPARRRRALRERARERRQLVHALQREGLLPEGRLHGAWLRRNTLDVALAAYRYLARSNAGLVLAYFEDILGLVEQVNLPGTVTEHPNWQRTLPLELDALLDDPRILELFRQLQLERPGTTS